MQRKDLALRVLSTAAIMSIVTSIAAPAFAGTYYMGNGNLSIRKEADGSPGLCEYLLYRQRKH